MRVVELAADERECILGLEIRAGDDFEALSAAAAAVTVGAIAGLGVDPFVLACAIERDVIAVWPDRAYFIEVAHDADGRRWVQLFQPWQASVLYDGP